MVSSTPGTETERRIALHDKLQGTEQGYHKRGMADTDYEGDSTAYWKPQAQCMC